MAVTNYYSFGGEILGEETGGVRRDYLTDALGSVTATVTSAGAVENTYRYKPYGEQLAKTGTGQDPTFLWIGTWGYYSSPEKSVYVRARFYSCRSFSWLSADPLGYVDDINKWSYSRRNPVTVIDPSGLESSIAKGLCGSNADDWFKNELVHQMDGYDKWSFGWKPRPAGAAMVGGDGYLEWANGNQRYKDPNFFKFNDKPKNCCGTDGRSENDKAADIGRSCGTSVRICGYCIASSILGNMMYGIVGKYIDISLGKLTYEASERKKFGGKYDPRDEKSYKLGWELAEGLNIKRPRQGNKLSSLCEEFKKAIGKNPTALLEPAKGGGFIDLSKCGDCKLTTREQRHGGDNPARKSE